MHVVRLAASRALPTTGINRAMSIAMMVITTSSSTSVKPLCSRRVMIFAPAKRSRRPSSACRDRHIWIITEFSAASNRRMKKTKKEGNRPGRLAALFQHQGHQGRTKSTKNEESGNHELHELHEWF